jgi:hypothetical protein
VRPYPKISITWGPFTVPLDKTGGKKHRRNISPLHGGEELNAKLEKPLWGWSGSVALVEESQALNCLVETGSKLKTISLREKLISNSWDCPVSGRSWQLLIYQPLMGPFLRTCML